jgi:hypothetical protein
VQSFLHLNRNCATWTSGRDGGEAKSWSGNRFDSRTTLEFWNGDLDKFGCQFRFGLGKGGRSRAGTEAE